MTEIFSVFFCAAAQAPWAVNDEAARAIKVALADFGMNDLNTRIFISQISLLQLLRLFPRQALHLTDALFQIALSAHLKATVFESKVNAGFGTMLNLVSTNRKILTIYCLDCKSGCQRIMA